MLAPVQRHSRLQVLHQHAATTAAAGRVKARRTIPFDAPHPKPEMLEREELDRAKLGSKHFVCLATECT